MKSVELKQLKYKLSEYIRLAQQGETVLVTDRDTVVARIVPPDEGSASRVTDSGMLDLVRRGVLSPALAASEEPPPSYGTSTWEEVKASLDEDRSER